MKRSDAREKVFKIIFQKEFHDDFADMYPVLVAEEGLKGVQGKYAQDTIAGILEHIEVIDDMIEKNLKNWTFERIPKASLAILRLGIYEIVFNSDIPDISAIDEGVKLASDYCDEKEIVFVNGLLNKIHQDGVVKGSL